MLRFVEAGSKVFADLMERSQGKSPFGSAPPK